MPSSRQFSEVTKQPGLSLHILPVSTEREVQASSFISVKRRGNLANQQLPEYKQDSWKIAKVRLHTYGLQRKYPKPVVPCMLKQNS